MFVQLVKTELIDLLVVMDTFWMIHRRHRDVNILTISLFVSLVIFSYIFCKYRIINIKTITRCFSNMVFLSLKNIFRVIWNVSDMQHCMHGGEILSVGIEVMMATLD